mgnify:CR=1 FL=1
MEVKKSKKADLESKRTLFLELGFVLALGLVLLAFEWTSRPAEVEGFSRDEGSDLVQENIPVTRQEERREPPPPPPPQSTEVINIVENDVVIQDELVLEQTEADQDTRVSIDAFAVDDEEEEEEQIFVVVEDMPSFRGGGLNAFARFVQQKLVYPYIAQENGIEGTVFLRFIVDKDGSVTNVEVVRGVDPALDKAAIEAVQKAPKWEPGKQRGKPVKVSCTIPISFTLE